MPVGNARGGAKIGAEGNDDDNIADRIRIRVGFQTSGSSCAGEARRLSRSWSGGTNRWSVPWHIAPAATWHSARTWPRRPFGRRGAQRASLEQPERLRRGCAASRGTSRRTPGARHRGRSNPPSTQDVLTELSTDEPGPAEEAVSREEESLVWQALERIPEAYREPLILFYREDQSVAEVAGALVLSEDAVKQRLSRGRGMLREQVAELVEGSLRRSRPGRTVHRELSWPAWPRTRPEPRRPWPGLGQCWRESVEGGGWSRRCRWCARGPAGNARRPVGRVARHLGPGPGRPHPPRA